MMIPRHIHYVSLCAILVFGMTSSLAAQISCPDGVTITANEKCMFLTWESPPDPLPSNIDALDSRYEFESGTGIENDEAIYRNSDPGNGACNSNQFDFTGEMLVDGNPCQFLDGILGVEWIAVEVKKQSSGILVKWTVVADQFNSYFQVERSSDGFQWITIEHRENSMAHEVESYSYQDKAPHDGLNYYRISQTDRSGQRSFSKIVSVNFEVDDDFQIFQNNRSIVIHKSGQEYQKPYRVYISDISGKIHYELGIKAQQNQMALDIQNLTTGMYFVIILNNSEILSKKVFIN